MYIYVKIHSDSKFNTITMKSRRKAKQVTKKFPFFCLFYLPGLLHIRNKESFIDKPNENEKENHRNGWNERIIPNEMERDDTFGNIDCWRFDISAQLADLTFCARCCCSAFCCLFHISIDELMSMFSSFFLFRDFWLCWMFFFLPLFVSMLFPIQIE